MRPHDDYRNGNDEGGAEGDSDGEERGGAEWALMDAEAPARALGALNALRKSRQYYDVTLVAGGGEVAAHRAVLAAASPHLLQALAAAAAALAATAPAAAPPPPSYRVEGVDAEALAALVEYAYTGRLAAADAGAARRLYRAAWQLRMEPARAFLAERLTRRAAPHDCLDTRALPDLAVEHLAALDAYIAEHFDEICECGALRALPLIRIELLRESSADDGEEAPGAVAAAALDWLRDRATDTDLEQLCSRTHLLFVDEEGALRDCGELPVARGDAPELCEYRREAAERAARREPRAADPRAAPARPALESGVLELGVRPSPAAECAVLAARRLGARGTRALLALRGRLAAARVAWRAGGPVARGAPLEGARDPPAGVLPRAELEGARAAHGTAVLDGRLIVCGGYDRARVMRTAEAYDPSINMWMSLPQMRGPRARFPAARFGDAVFAIGGSDGHAELDSVDRLCDGMWSAGPKLPLALSHAGAATAGDALYAVGGWAGGRSVRRVLRYTEGATGWTEAPPLTAPRSQCAAVHWAGALWALGGCDEWHCLASTERLPLDVAGAVWTPGPALPTARRSVGGATWRGLLVSAGGSDGAASLRRVDWLTPGASAWQPGPPLRRARAAPGLAVLTDTLYAVGGFDGKRFLACVECLYAPDDEWTALTAPPPRRAPAPDADAGAGDDAAAGARDDACPKESKENGNVSAQ